MIPEQKSRWRLLVLGFLLPVFLIWALYYFLLNAYFVDVFRFHGARAEFSREFFKPEFSARFPPIDLVVLGDSTAKSAFDPRAYGELFAVNLALNGGTALTAYQMLDRYLRHYPKPKCVMYVSQYNWRRNYSYFFERIVSYGVLDFKNIFDVWKRGLREGVFPHNEYSSLGFFVNSLRYSIFMGELPLNLMQWALYTNMSSRDLYYQKAQQLMTEGRGFQDNRLRIIQPEALFFTPELHGAYLRPFAPYASEDYYLRQLIEKTQELGIKLLWAELPLADSENYVAASFYQRQRDLYVLSMMQDHAHVIQVPMPLNLPRKFYYDFTHLMPSGASELWTYFDPPIRQHCGGGK